jgi:hypothetical protein
MPVAELSMSVVVHPPDGISDATAVQFASVRQFFFARLKRIRAKQEMENLMNRMENSPRTFLLLETTRFRLKNGARIFP